MRFSLKVLLAVVTYMNVSAGILAAVSSRSPRDSPLALYVIFELGVSVYLGVFVLRSQNEEIERTRLTAGSAAYAIGQVSSRGINEIPHAAYRVVGWVRYRVRAADRVVGAEPFLNHSSGG